MLPSSYDMYVHNPPLYGTAKLFLNWVAKKLFKLYIQFNVYQGIFYIMEQPKVSIFIFVCISLSLQSCMVTCPLQCQSPNRFGQDFMQDMIGICSFITSEFYSEHFLRNNCRLVDVCSWVSEMVTTLSTILYVASAPFDQFSEGFPQYTDECYSLQ